MLFKACSSVSDRDQIKQISLINPPANNMCEKHVFLIKHEVPIYPGIDQQKKDYSNSR